MADLEQQAQRAIEEAVEALRRAVAAYEAAGFGGHVTDPLRDALKAVQWSARELR